MQFMSADATAPSNVVGMAAGGLPKVNYYAPVVVTLLAAVVLFLFCLGMAIMGALNALTQWNRVADKTPGASGFNVVMCGTVGLIALVGALYFLWAVVKGVRDLGEGPRFTRGTVTRGTGAPSRKADNWLKLEAAYTGPDLATASRITDEQAAASVDRSRIFQPRFASDMKAGPERPDPYHPPTPADTPGGYLSADRISSRKDAGTSGAEEGAGRVLRVVFRVDFMGKNTFAPEEEVLVAHSRYLEHVFYVARLREGSWEAIRNRKLI